MELQIKVDGLANMLAKEKNSVLRVSYETQKVTFEYIIATLDRILHEED